jgi:hypothetical protein
MHNGMGASIHCAQCEKTSVVTKLDASKLPGPHGPGASGCVPGFRGDPAHYQAAFEAGARAKARRKQLLDEGVLPALLFSKLLSEGFYVKGDFDGKLRLAGANLQGALFFWAHKAFESADLRGANLDEATFLGTSLSKANLDGASLRDARLSAIQNSRAPPSAMPICRAAASTYSRTDLSASTSISVPLSSKQQRSSARRSPKIQRSSSKARA